MNQEFKNKLKSNISKGETIKVIDLILQNTDEKQIKLLNYVTLVKSNFNDIQIKRNLGIITEDYYRTELNKLNNTLLKLIDNDFKAPKSEFRRNRLPIIIVIVLASALIFLLRAYLIKEEKKSQLAQILSLEQRDVISQFQNIDDAMLKIEKLVNRQKLDSIGLTDLKDAIQKTEIEYKELQERNINAIKKNDYPSSYLISQRIRKLDEKYGLKQLSNGIRIDSILSKYELSKKIDQLESFLNNTSKLDSLRQDSTKRSQ